jgi:YkoY family integral membrane protein
MFGQTFDLHDLVIIGLLIVLEGVLSIDNALVLGLLAKRLPKRLQGKALTYGLVGAFVFRVIAIGLATYLLHWRIVKLVGGLYLIYVSVKHFFFDSKEAEQPGGPIPVAATPGGGVVPTGDGPDPHDPADAGRKCAPFWPTVVVIELTDIAFAIDSILAAIALVGPPPPGHDPSERFHPKLWVVVTGGMLGVILMRFAAVLFIRLLERFPRFETSAYLLVILIGFKLMADWWFNPDPQHPHPMFNFHSYHSPGFWVFWVLMVAFFCVGFIPARGKQPPAKMVDGAPGDEAGAAVRAAVPESSPRA